MEECFPAPYPHREPPVAPCCDDQLPVFSTVGRGIKGDSYEVVISDPDSDCETYLEGRSYDEATQSWTTEWKSENINGGKLMSSITFHPYQSLPTFVMNFKYLRPGRPEWSMSTPAIPYYLDVDGQNNGTGVATVYVKNITGGTDDWKDMMTYPAGTTGKDWNVPNVNRPWTVNLTYGLDGDIACPNVDDLALIIGVDPEDIISAVNNREWSIGGKNLKDYIDNQDDAIYEHMHKDFGFGQDKNHGEFASFAGCDNIKDYIDKRTSIVRNATKDQCYCADSQFATSLTYIVDGSGVPSICIFQVEVLSDVTVRYDSTMIVAQIRDETLRPTYVTTLNEPTFARVLNWMNTGVDFTNSMSHNTFLSVYNDGSIKIMQGSKSDTDEDAWMVVAGDIFVAVWVPGCAWDKVTI